MGMTGALLYMVLLGYGAIITPGVGTAGSLLAFVPQAVTEFSHVPAYAVLTWLLTSGLCERGWPKQAALWVGVGAAMVFGLWMEIFQAFVPGRVTDIGDVTCNAIGIGFAALLISMTPERSAYAFAKRSLHRVR